MMYFTKHFFVLLIVLALAPALSNAQSQGAGQLLVPLAVGVWALQGKNRLLSPAASREGIHVNSRGAMWTDDQAFLCRGSSDDHDVEWPDEDEGGSLVPGISRRVQGLTINIQDGSILYQRVGQAVTEASSALEWIMQNHQLQKIELNPASFTLNLYPEDHDPENTVQVIIPSITEPVNPACGEWIDTDISPLRFATYTSMDEIAAITDAAMKRKQSGDHELSDSQKEERGEHSYVDALANSNEGLLLLSGWQPPMFPGTCLFEERQTDGETRIAIDYGFERIRLNGGREENGSLNYKFENYIKKNNNGNRNEEDSSSSDSPDSDLGSDSDSDLDLGTYLGAYLGPDSSDSDSSPSGSASDSPVTVHLENNSAFVSNQNDEEYQKFRKRRLEKADEAVNQYFRTTSGSDKKRSRDEDSELSGKQWKYARIEKVSTETESSASNTEVDADDPERFPIAKDPSFESETIARPQVPMPIQEGSHPSYHYHKKNTEQVSQQEAEEKQYCFKEPPDETRMVMLLSCHDELIKRGISKEELAEFSAKTDSEISEFIKTIKDTRKKNVLNWTPKCFKPLYDEHFYFSREYVCRRGIGILQLDGRYIANPFEPCTCGRHRTVK